MTMTVLRTREQVLMDTDSGAPKADFVVSIDREAATKPGAQNKVSSWIANKSNLNADFPAIQRLTQENGESVNECAGHFCLAYRGRACARARAHDKWCKSVQPLS
jgi:hypothetical protein